MCNHASSGEAVVWSGVLAADRRVQETGTVVFVLLVLAAAPATAVGTRVTKPFPNHHKQHQQQQTQDQLPDTL